MFHTKTNAATAVPQASTVPIIMVVWAIRGPPHLWKRQKTHINAARYPYVLLKNRVNQFTRNERNFTPVRMRRRRLVPFRGWPRADAQMDPQAPYVQRRHLARIAT
jgi:hypothetical protein